LPLDKAWETARHEMREHTKTACRSQTSTKKVRNFSMNLDFSEESWRYVLLPVYIAVYDYQQQRFQVMVNGQDGKISGQRPADWVKIWLVIAALMTPALLAGLAGLILLFFGGLGFPILLVAFALAGFGIAISLKIFKDAQELDDD
jgi:hypothetical protein